MVNVQCGVGFRRVGRVLLEKAALFQVASYDPSIVGYLRKGVKLCGSLFLPVIGHHQDKFDKTCPEKSGSQQEGKLFALRRRPS